MILGRNGSVDNIGRSQKIHEGLEMQDDYDMF